MIDLSDSLIIKLKNAAMNCWMNWVTYLTQILDVPYQVWHMNLVSVTEIWAQSVLTSTLLEWISLKLLLMLGVKSTKTYGAKLTSAPLYIFQMSHAILRAGSYIAMTMYCNNWLKVVLKKKKKRYSHNLF